MRARTGTARGARIYRILRTAHLERARSMAPADLMYERARYDFDADLAREIEPEQCSTIRCAARVVRRDYAWIEVNEPVALEAVRRTSLVLLAVRLKDATYGRRHRTRVLTYAIGNMDPFSLPRPRRPRARLGRILDDRLVRWVWGQVDRVAFGTHAAETTYDRSLGRGRPGLARTLIPALPSACACPAAPITSGTGAATARLLFVGDLSPRKGFDLAVAAWTAVRRQQPDASWVIVGKGAMVQEARQLAAVDPLVTFVEDPPRSRVHAELRRADVLVLLSRRTPAWIEQVGLPVVEALAHGVAVVTTPATGLASWLRDHGHRVLSEDATAEDVARELLAALRERRPRSTVLGQLPSRDGRLAADDWLVTGVG